MDDLFKFIDAISNPPHSPKTNSTRDQSASTEPTFSFEVKRNEAGDWNGLHFRATNRSEPIDPNEKGNASQKARKSRVNANVTGPIEAQILGRVKESSSGFQADLDFSINDKTNSPPGNGYQAPECKWETYNSSQHEKSGGSIKFDQILDTFFSSKATQSTFHQLPTLINVVENIMTQTTPQEGKPTANNSDELENQIIYQSNNITGTYHTDVDLFRIDGLIRENIKRENNTLPDKLKKIDQLKLKKQNSVRQSEIVEIDKELTRLITRVEEIRFNKDLIEYESKSTHYLNEYRKMGRQMEVIKFGQENAPHQVDSKRLKIIMSYIGIAKKYININLIHVERMKYDCEICQADLKNIMPNKSGMIKCPKCSVEKHSPPSLESDNQISHFPGKTNYSDIEGFNKSADRLEGKQKVKFPAHLIDVLDEYFISKGYPSRRDITRLPLVGSIEGRRRRQGTNREIMITALQETGYTDFYEDCNLLCNIIWGSELPDLTMIRERLQRDYEYSQPIFNQVKGKRKSSLSADYRLFRQLWHLGFPCHPLDFKIVRTPAIINYYEEVWEKMCNIIGKELGWKPFVRIEVLMKMDINTLKLPPQLTIK